ncbi:MAG: hypothetical protein ABEJ26_07730 [Halosimplex sp.]
MSQRVQRRLTYRLRRAVGPTLDRTVRSVVDETLHIYPREYAATVRCEIQDLESLLSSAGFRWNPLSMYHYTEVGNRTDGSWVLRDSPLADRQLHAILIRQGPERIDVYAHDEYSWLRHPVAHAEEVDLDREGGAARMREILRDMDVECVEESKLRRKAEHVTRRVRKRVGATIPG